jgi:RNA polymerase sigma-70 factor (ECF subfamily)
MVMRQRAPQVSDKDAKFARVVATHRHALLRYALRRAGRILANVLRGHQRSMRLEMRLALERERENDTQRYDEEDLKQMIWALSQVKSEERELLHLTYWERLSYREVGAVLGCTEKAAGIRISRARQHLRQFLNETDATATITRLPNQETL